MTTLRRLAPICLAVLLAGCGGAVAQAPGWTLGPALSGDPAAAQGSARPSGSPTSAPSSIASPSAAGSVAPSPDASSATAKPFSGRMTPQVLLVGGYVTMYMDLVNTGSEPLTFLNTLYDIEPTRLYSPTVAFPWTSGDTAVVTRAGRFFPSPAIVQPGQRAVYVMGGMPAKGTGVLGTPVANIKFCPTRGMDDIPSVPVGVRDLTWSSSAGVTTVHGTLVESAGSRRVDPPVIGVAFFDKAGAFVGAVVDSRNGDRLAAGASRSFTMEGRGVDAARIFRAEGYAFVS